jgi:hypothetical protein
MQAQLDQATGIAAWFENLLHYDSAVAVALALVGSWVITVTLAYYVRPAVSMKWRVRVIRGIDVIAAGVICGCMWPHNFDVIWGAVIGCLSPVAYKVLSWALTRWVPSLASLLSLHELLADPPVKYDVEDSENL